MDPITVANVANFLFKLASLAPTIIKSVEDAKPFAVDIISRIQSKTPPTQAEWDALHAKIDELTADIEEPI